MKKQFAVALFACLTLIATFWIGADSNASASASTPRYGLDVVVKPDPTTPGAALCTFHVTNLATGRDVASPSIITAYGQAAETVTIDPNGQQMTFRALADKTTGSVTSSMTVSKGKSELARFSSETTMPR